MIARILAFTAACILAQPASAAVFGLVVGINAYDAQPVLEGALDDAADIEQALNKYGAQRVITLLDQEASKAAIASGYDALLAEAKPGDTLVFSYAGHGSQAPARVPSEEADGLDEFFLLSSFDRTKPATQGEMILDDEIRAWMLRAEEKGVKVILVADSCHSGGMQRATNAKYRYAPPVEFPLGLDSIDAQAGASITEEQLRSAMFFSASLESQLTPEVQIGGSPRGALSYAFSRALEGSADTDGDGQTTRGELESYVVSTVETQGEMLQTPVVRPRGAEAIDEVVFSRSATVEVASKPVPPVVPTLAFSVISGNAAEFAGTSPGGQSDYRWNGTTLQFCSPLGEVVASDVSPEKVQDVIDKFRILELLKQQALASTGEIKVEPSKSLYLAGDRIALSAPGWQSPNAVVFNLANTGEVQFVAEAEGGQGETLEIGRTSVVEPFGGDHLVVMSLGGKSANLGVVLKRRPAPTTSELLSALPLLMAGQEARIAIQPLYTAESAQRVAIAPSGQPQEIAACN